MLGKARKVNRAGYFLMVLYLMYLTASSMTMPETRIYSIYVPVERKAANSGNSESIVIHLNSERYLKQPYIAYRDSKYELEISKYSKWDTSPVKIVRKDLKDVLQSEGIFREVKAVNIRPKDFYLLKVDLKSFERYDDGGNSFGMLKFDVSLVSPDGKELYSETVSKKEAIDSRNFSALAKGLSTALQQAIEEVSTKVVEEVNKDN